VAFPPRKKQKRSHRVVAKITRRLAKGVGATSRMIAGAIRDREPSRHAMVGDNLSTQTVIAYQKTSE
jgi:hypothetical protein